MTFSPPLTHRVAESKICTTVSAVNPVAPSAAVVPVPRHDPSLTEAFLHALDPCADRFTVQLFRDPKHRKNEGTPPGLKLIQHCSTAQVCALAREWNTPEHGFGLYVAINETDFAGRKRENIVRVRAVFVDADEDLMGVATRLRGLLAPSAIVKSSTGRAQFYWWVDDSFPIDQFELVQRALIKTLGTDPSVNDLARVMRLPGTMHQKSKPQLVTLKLGSHRRYSFNEIVEGLAIARHLDAPHRPIQAASIDLFPPRTPLSGPSDLAAGIVLPEFDFSKARSAGLALASAGKLDSRDGWLTLWLFPLTYEAQLNPEIERDLKSLHDEVAASTARLAAARGIRGTDEWAAGNDVQWEITMSRVPTNPRTMGSVYEAAHAIGWNPPLPLGDSPRMALNGQIIGSGQTAPVAIPSLELRPLPPIPGGKYSEKEGLRLFLERYAFVREGGNVSFFVCDTDGRLVRSDEASIEAELRNVYVLIGSASDGSGEQKTKPLFQWWKGNPNRPQVRVAVFNPHGDVAAHEFNMWRGWGVEPLPGFQNMLPLLRHIWLIICRRNRRKFRYLMRWLAWTVQNPDKPPGVAVVLHSSREGAGKSTLSEVMLKIFGVHGTIVDTSEGLLGKHNDNLEYACFVAVEEAVFAGDRKVADQLKSRLTATSTTIEPKFKARRSAPNRLHAMITTNHTWSAPAGDGARRWFVLSISEEKVGDSGWFEPIYAGLDRGGYGQFLHLLLRLDIGPWNPRQLEKTNELFDQQIMSASWTKQWLLASAEQDAFVGGFTTFPLGADYPVNKLHAPYCDWMRSCSRKPDTIEFFCREIASVVGKPSRPRSPNGGRIRQRHFPDGATLRRLVLRSLNIPEDYEGWE